MSCVLSLVIVVVSAALVDSICVPGNGLSCEMPIDPQAAKHSPQQRKRQTSSVVVAIEPTSTTVIENCFPFGSGGLSPFGDWVPTMGFIYQNVPPFVVNVGDKIAFDLGSINDFDIEVSIALVATTTNGGNTANGAYTVIVNEQTAPTRGNTVVGDFDLEFTANAPFAFNGGGLMIRFTPSAAYFAADQVTCNQVLVATDSSDASGFFVGRFFRSNDGSGPFPLDEVDSGLSSLTGFRILATALDGSGNGDPHFVGANRVKYDFNGTANGTYVMFTAPLYQINMHLAEDGPATRFMTKVGVVFRNVTMRFGVYRYTDAHLADLNELLAPHGASAEYDGTTMRLVLCAGHMIVIKQMHANSKMRPWLAHDDGSVFYYVNIEIHTPHCDDAFGGVLGQTYKCKYVEQKEQFVFDPATEESFRVKSLAARSKSFDPNAPCSAPRPGGVRSVGGRSHH